VESPSPPSPRLRFHDLRHSHATQLLVEGIHPKVVQERLGHSSIAITLDLYSHVIGTLQEDAAARLDLAVGPAIRRLSRDI
jgi:integrase